ncbi:MAG: WxcM-like domain-containing protein [Tatlockia sp.]|nr:WxcM-like domain-containing protein [Tatlockia sp.]
MNGVIKLTNLPYIHETADVQSARIGKDTKIWQFVVILPGAKIGDEVNICSHCFVENDVIIGDRVTIKSGVQLWNGLRIEDDVFIGPNVTFSNDKFPRSKAYPEKFLETLIEKGASVGAGAVILPGLTIGRGAMIGAGAIVTKSVPSFAIVTSPAAKISGYVDSNFSLPPTESTESATKIGAPVGVGGVRLHKLKLVKDPRGELCVGEFMKDIPFSPKRYFLIFNVPEGKVRGEHAHYKCQQFLICVKGSCTIVVDDGESRAEIQLDTAEQGIYLPPLTWGTLYQYSSGAVLLAFTSDYYDAGDYIHNYDQFCEISKQHQDR